jgi:predicted component of viral defense system (DUF524 family)
MDNLLHNDPIQHEIKKLRLRVAILRHELREALAINTPLGMLKDTMQEICILQEQKLLLEMGRFKELPYNIQLLYS